VISKKYLSCIFEDKGKLFYIVYGQSGVQVQYTGIDAL